MKRPAYLIINVIYQLIICWLLVFVNAYYNDLLIPESLIHSSGKIGVKILIVLAESVLLVLIAYVINREALNDTGGNTNQKSIAIKTGIVQLFFTVFFIMAVILN